MIIQQIFLLPIDWGTYSKRLSGSEMFHVAIYNATERSDMISRGSNTI